MIFTIKDGKLFNEAGKSIPFTKLAGLTIEKIHKVKAGKEKDAIKLSLASTNSRVEVEEEPDQPEQSYAESDSNGDNKRQCRTEPVRGPKGPNKFLKMIGGLKVEPEKGFDKVNDNIKPTPRMRQAVPDKKYPVTCFVCNKTYKVPRHEVPPSIEGEQMSYRCNSCCKR